MPSIAIALFKNTIGLLVSEGREKVAEIPKGDDVMDQKFRSVIVKKIDDIKSKLDTLSRKDLKVSISFFEEGIELLYEVFKIVNATGECGAVKAQAPCDEGIGRLELTGLDESASRKLSTAKKRFKDARRKATEAFKNEGLKTSDRILAMKYRVMATILETVDNPADALAPCRVCVKELNSLPAVQNNFDVQLKTGIKTVRGLFNKEERRKVISSVCHVNRVVYDVTRTFGGDANVCIWPPVVTRDYKINPLCEAKITKAFVHQGMEPLCITPMSSSQESETKHKLKDSKVPLEIIFRGPSAILAYHQALSEGKTVAKRVPIMLIGQGKSGKTSLKRSLRRECFNPEETITRGIETDPSYSKVSQEVWKIGESGDEATNSDPAPISFEQCAAQYICARLKEGINSKEMKNVDGSNLESGIDPSYSKVSQEVWKGAAVRVEATNSDEERIKLTEIKKADTVDEVEAGPDLPKSIDVPDELATLIETLLQPEQAEDAQGKEDVYSVLWDFGGQSVYYTTHPLFLTPRAIYLLVHDLSRDPDGKDGPQVKRGFYEDIEDVFCERSNMDYLDLWMSSVSSLCREDEDFQEMLASEILPERLPPVFLVCTHADKPFQGLDPHASARKIFGSLKRRVYGKHLVGVFVVDNTKSGSKEKCPEVDRLRKEIETVAHELPQMKEAIPIKWLKFEKEIEEKKQDGHKWISLDEAKNIATEKCCISSTVQFAEMMHFLHNQRILVHFDDTPQLNRMVILDPQWLINVFKEVITIGPYQSQKRKYEQMWLKLATTGILEEELLQHIWGPLFDNRETCHTLIALMEKFCLLCPLSSSVGTDSPAEYFVPSMLKFPPLEDVRKRITSTGIPPLFIKFKSSQVPAGLFPRLVLMVFQWCTKEFSSQMGHQLYQNFARFYTHPAEGCSLILHCHSSFIKVVVHKERCAAGLSSYVESGQHMPSKSKYDALQVKFARAVCRQLRLILECMRKEFFWLKKMECDLLVSCPVCWASHSVNHCSSHNVRGCEEEQCLHMISESQLFASRGSIVCTRSVVAVKVPVDFVGCWFGSPEEWQAADEYNEKSPFPRSGDVHNDQAVFLCGEVLEALTTQTCDASEVVAQFQKSLSLENLSLEQPDADTKKKIRYLCLKAKTAKRLEVVKKLREITPAGTTGPLLPEEDDVAMIPLRLREELTINLSGGEEWMLLAERLGLTPAEIRFLDKRVLNPFDAALEHARKQGLIQNVGDLYDKLVDCELPLLADLL